MLEPTIVQNVTIQVVKLYLSSYQLGDNPQSLVNLVGANKKVAVIPNALDFSTDTSRRDASMQKEFDDLKQLGFEPEEVDLRKYFGKPKELAERLSDYGLVWARGGNAFILRKAYKESGFDEWLIGQRSNKELVYGGYSAGVCVLSPSLKGVDLVDDPSVLAEGYDSEVIWEGVGLIDFSFAPHYKSNHVESESVDKEIEYFVKNGLEYKALRDGEVIIQEIS